MSRATVTVLEMLPGGSRLLADAAESEQAEQERRFGDPGTRLLFENDRVRVWELRLAPEECTDLHEHEVDYVLVQISGDRVGADLDRDSKDALGFAGKHFESKVRPGLAVYVPKGGVERAVNVGRKEYHEVLIELKDSVC